MITIKNERFAKMYWELLAYCEMDFNLLAFITYIIDVYPILKDTKTIDGKEYKMLSNTIIMDKVSWSDSTIDRYIQKLKELGLIDIQNAMFKKGGKVSKHRWIHINVEIEGSNIGSDIGSYIGSDIGSYIGSDIGSYIGSDIGSKRTLKQNNRISDQYTNIESNTKKEEIDRRIEEIKRDNNVPLLEEVTKFIREDMKCNWKTEEDIIDFYNTTLFRGWKKASGAPITEWHAYFKWFAEHDKPKQTFDQDLVPDNKDKIDQWRKEI
jgi:hypothetical protein